MARFFEKWKTKDYLLYIAIIIPLVTLLLGLIYSAINKETDYTNVEAMFFNTIYPTIIIWSGCFVITTYLWKKFPWEQYPIKHLIGEIVLIAIYLLLFIASMVYINGVETWNEGVSFVQKNGLEVFNTYLITYLITAIHEAFYFYKQWQDNFSKSLSLEKDNIQAQYNALKAQINPHFLFNSLNSLISLVEGNPKAEKYIQDLSEFLRFVLQASEKETVSLREELDNLEKYIRLLELRFGNNLQVQFSIEPQELGRLIPPLVLQILLENCVQHNIITQAQALTVNIYTENNSILVCNKLQKKTESQSTGQGLKNIRGRYRFHNAEEIKVIETDKQFCVTLPLI